MSQLVLGVVFVVGGIALTYRKWPWRFAEETAEAFMSGSSDVRVKRFVAWYGASQQAALYLAIAVGTALIIGSVL